MFRFGWEVERKQLWAMEKGGGGNSYGTLSAAKPKVDCHKEVLLRHPKKESERFLQHGGSAERCDENGMFRFGVEVDGEQLWAMEKGGGGNSHCLMNAVN